MYEKISWDKNKDGVIAKTQKIDLFELFYALPDRGKLIFAWALIGGGVMAIFSVAIAKPVYQTTSKPYILNQRDSEKAGKSYRFIWKFRAYDEVRLFGGAEWLAIAVDWDITVNNAKIALEIY